MRVRQVIKIVLESPEECKLSDYEVNRILTGFQTVLKEHLCSDYKVESHVEKVTIE